MIKWNKCSLGEHSLDLFYTLFYNLNDPKYLSSVENQL